MSTPYILDTNTFINLNKCGYAINEPANAWFWEYLIELAHENFIKVPESVCEELCKGSDGLSEWIKTNKKDFVLHTSTVLSNEYGIVVNSYASFSPDGVMPETDLEYLGNHADSYVIAHAMKEGGEVVSSEQESNATRPKNVKIPCVCRKLAVPFKPFAVFIWEIASKRTLALAAKNNH